MNIKIILVLLSGLLAGGASAGLYTETFTVTGGTIADGNPVGAAFNDTVSDVSGNITGLTVGLNMSGGYNGDLYAYLVAPNGTLVVLMNQPGTSVFGAPGSGFSNFYLNDAATDGNIQTANETAGVQFGGTYQAAGNLADFNGGGANGTWTLYFADRSNGGGTSTLNSWTLGIEAVPEPVNLALGIFGLVSGIVFLVRRKPLRRFFDFNRCRDIFGKSR